MRLAILTVLGALAILIVAVPGPNGGLHPAEDGEEHAVEKKKSSGSSSSPVTPSSGPNPRIGHYPWYEFWHWGKKKWPKYDPGAPKGTRSLPPIPPNASPRLKASYKKQHQRKRLDDGREEQLDFDPEDKWEYVNGLLNKEPRIDMWIDPITDKEIYPPSMYLHVYPPGGWWPQTHTIFGSDLCLPENDCCFDHANRTDENAWETCRDFYHTGACFNFEYSGAFCWQNQVASCGSHCCSMNGLRRKCLLGDTHKHEKN